MAVGATHEDPATEQARERRFAQESERQIRERPARDEGDLAGPAARLVDEDVDAVALTERTRWRRKLGIAEPLRAVGLGRGLDRPYERPVASEGDLDVEPAGELEHRSGVPLD